MFSQNNRIILYLNMAKSWEEIFFSKKNYEIKTIQKNFCGHVSGSKMLIPTPLMIQEYINHIELDNISDVETMRKNLAIKYGADFTCPLSTGIFLRIVAEFNYENKKLKDFQICPFWRIINPNSKLSNNLTFDKKFLIRRRFNETR